ncbi:MAG: GLPGLI family protein [Lentimicrobium sp.]|jgi:GLPGLI family protein|nr:GLPGLI family protein [Lentimicrobium sp.]MDD2529049.1 GLPGLI family protein [Lentimicrobiaceae bacterium]MDD4599052.1 GLPGLI family protein [Lentimicrobiaceae bacterium]MDY0025153.1 GLPGLI family protein [Lentimicrobium sp.]HAH57502.1 hypothetical protein [Bacteroidales bacterium]
MDKKADFLKWIIGLFFLSCSVGAYPQFFEQNPKVLDTAALVVTYSHLWKEDTLNPDFPGQEDILLMLGKTTSQFMSKNFHQRRVVGRRMEREGKLDEYLNSPFSERVYSRFTYVIYKNYPPGKITYINRIIPSTFEYTEAMDIFKWALGNEFADILGYKVQKATTRYGGRDWIAWFSSEIPYNDGPYKFCGLPGLILKLNDAEEHYVFEAVAIERPDETVLLEISKRDRVVTTRIKYLQAEENFRSDIISRGKDAGMSNKTQQIMARNMLKRNNPIELE